MSKRLALILCYVYCAMASCSYDPLFSKNRYRKEPRHNSFLPLYFLYHNLNNQLFRFMKNLKAFHNSFEISIIHFIKIFCIKIVFTPLRSMKKDQSSIYYLETSLKWNIFRAMQFCDTFCNGIPRRSKFSSNMTPKHEYESKRLLLSIIIRSFISYKLFLILLY